MNWPSFQRALRYAQRYPSAKLAALSTGIGAAIVAPLLIVILGVLVDLLATRGNLSVPPDQREAAEALAARPADQAGPQQARFENRGLLPLVWRNRETWWGGLLGRVYSSWPALQTNRWCLLAIVLLGWLLALTEALLLWLMECSIQQLAGRVVTRLSIDIEQQAVRLGSSDWLSSRRFGPTDLLGTGLEEVRQGLVSWWRFVPHAVVLAVLLLLLMLATQIWLTIAALVACCLGWLLLGWLSREATHRAALLGDRASKQGTLLLESLRRSRLLLGRNDADVHDHFAAEITRLRGFAQAQHTAGAGVGPLVLFLGLAGVGLIFLLIGFNALQEPPQMALSAAAVLFAALCTLPYPLWRWTQLQHALPHVEQAADEVMSYIDRNPTVGQVANAKPLNRLLRVVSFEHISLADEQGRRLLDDVSLSLPAGSRVAIVASDDVTPTAIAGLMPRYFDPVAGRLLFDGADIRLATLESLRGQVCVLLPDHVLYTATVSENIACGDARASLAQITEAAHAAHAYEFIQGLPQGFNTIVGDQGAMLDPTQVVRIALARVLLHDPAVILLEEPTGELDEPAADLMDQALEQVAQNRLLVILARRMSTLRNCERILLFHAGKLHAEGTHLELLQKSELYRHLNYVRFNEFRGQVQ